MLNFILHDVAAEPLEPEAPGIAAEHEPYTTGDDPSYVEAACTSGTSPPEAENANPEAGR
jgi:hypothetical protein